MSMFSGLEVRVPFCDHRIAKYLYNVPWSMKDLHGREKGLLREAVKGIVPEEIRMRKKSPYPKTHNPAYMRAVGNLLRQVLDEGTSPMFAFIRRDALEQLLTQSRAQPWYGQLMQTPQTIAYFAAASLDEIVSCDHSVKGIVILAGLRYDDSKAVRTCRNN